MIRDASVLTLGKKYRVKAFSTAETAIVAIQADPPDLVLLDIGLPGMSGIDAIKEIKIRCPEVLIIMITAYDDIGTVISAMKLPYFAISRSNLTRTALTEAFKLCF